jgi:hypothetical protein
MAYTKDFGKNAASGGPFPDKVTRKGNGSRPQSYIGNYTFDVPGKLSRGADDAKEHPGLAPQQGFRRDLPRAEVSGRLLDGQYSPDGVEPDWQDIQFKTWR